MIGETAEIGDDVTLYQGVTLGGTGFATGKRHPTVQDNVTIGSGAKLLGPITVGHGAKIGANSVVITDVPPNSTVVGNPGHAVRVDGRKPEGPDADWIHLPDPIADAIRALVEPHRRARARGRRARRTRELGPAHPARAARRGPPAVPAPRPEPGRRLDARAPCREPRPRGMMGAWRTSKASSPPSRPRSTPPARSTRRHSSTTSLAYLDAGVHGLVANGTMGEAGSLDARRSAARSSRPSRARPPAGSRSSRASRPARRPRRSASPPTRPRRARRP